MPSYTSDENLLYLSIYLPTFIGQQVVILPHSTALLSILLRSLPPDETAFEVIHASDLVGRVEHTRHHHEVHLPPQVIHFDTMHAEDATQQGVWVVVEILVVLGQDIQQELILLLRLSLQQVPAVVRVEEELAGLGVRDELYVVVAAYVCVALYAWGMNDTA